VEVGSDLARLTPILKPTGATARAVGLSLCLGLIPSACSPPPPPDAAWTDAELVARIDHRLGSEASVRRYSGSDAEGQPIYVQGLPPVRDLQIVARRRVGRERIICAYVTFRGLPGHEETSNVSPQVVMMRNGCLFTEYDLPAPVFLRWQNRYCGPDWVSPYFAAPSPNAR
jgi:hypothetical protein